MLLTLQKPTSSSVAAYVCAARDTTAAICGQLAGAFYGFGQIPDEWVKRLAMRDEILELSDRLLTERYAPQ